MHIKSTFLFPVTVFGKVIAAADTPPPFINDDGTVKHDLTAPVDGVMLLVSVKVYDYYTALGRTDLIKLDPTGVTRDSEGRATAYSGLIQR